MNHTYLSPCTKYLSHTASHSLVIRLTARKSSFCHECIHTAAWIHLSVHRFVPCWSILLSDCAILIVQLAAIKLIGHHLRRRLRDLRDLIVWDREVTNASRAVGWPIQFVTRAAIGRLVGVLDNCAPAHDTTRRLNRLLINIELGGLLGEGDRWRQIGWLRLQIASVIYHSCLVHVVYPGDDNGVLFLDFAQVRMEVVAIMWLVILADAAC